MKYTVIDTNKQGFSTKVKETFMYKDLIALFVKRDFITIYKQTILGPLWIVLQPLLTTLIFAVVFGRIAGIDTGVPPLLFYLSGIVIWAYFADNLNKIAETFTENQHIFSKVYFPRLVLPFSQLVTHAIKFGIQFALFALIYLYYQIFILEDSNVHPNIYLALLPVLIIIAGTIALGAGLIIASLTTKYRDLKFLIRFGVQLMMYASPIVYPLSLVEGKFRTLLVLNPMTSIIETFKYGLFGKEFAIFEWTYLGYSAIFAMLILWIGLVIFNRFERSFIDTI